MTEVLGDEGRVVELLASQVAAVWRSTWAVTCFAMSAHVAARRMMLASVVS